MPAGEFLFRVTIPVLCVAGGLLDSLIWHKDKKFVFVAELSGLLNHWFFGLFVLLNQNQKKYRNNFPRHCHLRLK